MNRKLFQSVKELHDGKGRVVFICIDKSGHFIYKPSTGFKSKHWASVDDPELIACFERQAACSQNTGFLETHEVPAADEDYTLLPPVKTARATKPAAAAKPAAEKPAAAKKKNA